MSQVPGVIVYMGQNTLVLMCLNGVFYHYINQPLAKWVLTNFGGNPITVTVAGVVTTVISLLLCIPFLYGFNRYLAQFIGKKKQNVMLQGGASFQ
jgi:acyltransferase